jgi:hypothetical protein
MELFFYCPIEIKPIQILVCKVDNEELFNLTQDLSHHIFNSLFNSGLSTTNNLLILSIIKDHTQTISNLIIPSIHTNKELTIYFTNTTENTNKLIKNVLINCDTKCFIELKEDDIIIKYNNYNLSSLSDFY